MKPRIVTLIATVPNLAYSTDSVNATFITLRSVFATKGSVSKSAIADSNDSLSSQICFCPANVIEHG